jgi:DNA-directed RNA polymerase specialized sigma24 family protein
MYARLLQRAVELSGSREGGEDLVQSTFLVCVTHPPKFYSNLKLLHWMRTTMWRLNAAAARREKEAADDHRLPSQKATLVDLEAHRRRRPAQGKTLA